MTAKLFAAGWIAIAVAVLVHLGALAAVLAFFGTRWRRRREKS